MPKGKGGGKKGGGGKGGGGGGGGGFGTVVGDRFQNKGGGPAPIGPPVISKNIIGAETTNAGRPPGWDRGYEDGLDGGTWGGGTFNGGEGSNAGGGGGGSGAAGSNPLSGLGFAAEKITAQGGLEGTNVEEITQAQGAKKSKKQRKREATY